MTSCHPLERTELSTFTAALVVPFVDIIVFNFTVEIIAFIVEFIELIAELTICI